MPTFSSAGTRDRSVPTTNARERSTVARKSLSRAASAIAWGIRRDAGTVGGVSWNPKPGSAGRVMTCAAAQAGSATRKASDRTAERRMNVTLLNQRGSRGSHARGWCFEGGDGRQAGRRRQAKQGVADPRHAPEEAGVEDPVFEPVGGQAEMAGLAGPGDDDPRQPARAFDGLAPHQALAGG